jgi:acetoin utilization deacetylase AcuC-like enzyme
MVNSIAAGAFHALEAHRCERVAIIDLDIHHGKTRPDSFCLMIVKCLVAAGNGTEDIVRRYADPSRLFFFSLHLYEKEQTFHFFPGSGEANDVVCTNNSFPI